MADERRPPQTPPGQEGRPPQTRPPKPAALRGMADANGWLVMYWTGTEHRGDAFEYWAWTDDDPLPRPLRYTPAGTFVWCDEEEGFCAAIPLGLSLEDYAPVCPQPHPVPRPEGRA